MYIYIWHVYLYMYIRCIYVYIYIWYVFLCIQHVYLYITLQKKIQTLVGTLEHGHCGEDIIKVPLWKHFSASFFWFTTLYRVQHDGFWAFCLWPWQIWMDGWHQPTAAICSWEPLQLRFFWCVVLNEPIPNSDFSLHLRLCAWAWRVNGQHVWAVTGSPVFFLNHSHT